MYGITCQSLWNRSSLCTKYTITSQLPSNKHENQYTAARAKRPSINATVGFICSYIDGKNLLQFCVCFPEKKFPTLSCTVHWLQTKLQYISTVFIRFSYSSRVYHLICYTWSTLVVKSINLISYCSEKRPSNCPFFCKATWWRVLSVFP